MPGNSGDTDPLWNLSWNDLETWVGSKTLVRGRKYMREHRVGDLSRTSGGELVAWVTGSENYATAVAATDGKLRSWCTCPVGTSCKHAVATVLEYLDSLKNGVPVRTPSDNDPRFSLITRAMAAHETDLPFPMSLPKGVLSEICGESGSRTELSPGELLHAHFESLPKADLVVLLDELCNEYPEIRQNILAQHVLDSADPKTVLESLRTDINALAIGHGVEEPWDRLSEDPDYSSINERFEMLLASGFADDVVKCGLDLFRNATIMIEELDEDEDAIVWEIIACIQTVFLALDKSALPVPERMMYVADLEFDDDYGLCPHDHAFWNGPFTKDDWSRFADLLIAWRDAGQHTGDMSENYRVYSSENYYRKLFSALDAAGRSEDAIRICLEAATKPGYSPTLVSYLIQWKRYEDARQWIGRENQREHRHHGTDVILHDLMRKLWKEEDDWLHIAGLQAEEFLTFPSIQGYRELKMASERAGVWPGVSESLMDYLVQDKKPRSCISQSGNDEIIMGMLPRSGAISLRPERMVRAPAYELLLAIAIDEKDPDNVLAWYDRAVAEKRAFLLSTVLLEEIADALMEKYPQQALTIRKPIVEAYLKETKPKSYELAIKQIRNIKETLDHQDQHPAWALYLAELKTNHKRRKLFLDMLLLLDERPIVQQ